MVWDGANRLSTVNGTGASYTYDAIGWRVQKTTGSGSVQYLFDGLGNVTEELNGFALNRAEIYLGNTHLGTYTGGNTYFSHTDLLGSERVRTLMTAPNTAAQTCANLPFGDSQSCTGTETSPLHFTGLERDTESGLDQTWYRKYSSAQGRWLTPDPYAGESSDPQSLNRYPYVGGNPAVFVDPLGLRACVDKCPDWAFEGGSSYGYVDGVLMSGDIISFLLNAGIGAVCPDYDCSGVRTGPDGQFQILIKPAYSYYRDGTYVVGTPVWKDLPTGFPVYAPTTDPNAANNDSWAWTFTKSFFTGFTVFGPKNDPRPSCFGNFLKDSAANFVGIPGIDTVGAGATAYYGVSLSRAQAVPSSRALRGGLSAKQWLRADEAARLTNAGRFSIALNAVIAEGQAIAKEVPSALAGECK